MKLEVLDKTGKSIEQLELADNLFGVKPNESILSQYIRIYQFNQRQGTSSTKTRGEVSGGGKKPWRQKGTGRARVGSSRNPIWRHGGISHGPKPRSWKKTMPQKMRMLALASALSFKSTKKNIVVLNELKIKTPSTSTLLKILEATKVLDKRTLIVLATNDASIIKSASNIPQVSVAQVNNLNAYEVSLAKKVLFIKDSVIQLHDKYKPVEVKATPVKKSKKSSKSSK